MKEGCRVMPGGGNPRESATEKSLPWWPGLSRKGRLAGSTVRVKRWGKSPPRAWQQDWHGKPHPEQCRIGASRGKVCPYAFGRAETSTGTLQPGGPGWQLDRPGNGCGRGMVIQGGQPPGQNPAYRPSAHLLSSRCFAWRNSCRSQTIRLGSWTTIIEPQVENRHVRQG